DKETLLVGTALLRAKGDTLRRRYGAADFVGRSAGRRAAANRRPLRDGRRAESPEDGFPALSPSSRAIAVSVRLESTERGIAASTSRFDANSSRCLINNQEERPEDRG